MSRKPGMVEYIDELTLRLSSHDLLSWLHVFDTSGCVLSLYIMFSGGQTIFSRLEDPVDASLIQSFPQHRLETFIDVSLQDSHAGLGP